MNRREFAKVGGAGVLGACLPQIAVAQEVKVPKRVLVGLTDEEMVALILERYPGYCNVNFRWSSLTQAPRSLLELIIYADTSRRFVFTKQNNEPVLELDGHGWHGVIDMRLLRFVRMIDKAYFIHQYAWHVSTEPGHPPGWFKE